MIILYALSLLYTLFILLLIYGLSRLDHVHISQNRPRVSVIIPSRNEGKNIKVCLQRLCKQTYPRDLYDVWVVDDDSRDETRIIAQKMAHRFDNLHYIKTSAAYAGMACKKAALMTGINASNGEIIVSTDADCTMPPAWLEHLVSAFTPDVDAALSWLIVRTDNRFFSHIESIDSLGFVVIGAAAVGLNRPFLANGANFAYRRSAFVAINGFDHIGSIGSGDDDLLLQKLPKHKIRFICHDNAAVCTNPCPTWRAFFKQRLRWASKSKLQRTEIKILSALMFGVYFTLVLSLPLHWFARTELFPFMLLLAGKMIMDYVLLSCAIKKINRKIALIPFALAEVLQILYLPFIALYGLWGRYEWKGRSYKRGKLNCRSTHIRT